MDIYFKGNTPIYEGFWQWDNKPVVTINSKTHVMYIAMF